MFRMLRFIFALCILHTNSLLDVLFTNISFHFVCCLLFLFIYFLFMIVTEREAETQAEGEAGSVHCESDVGFDPGSPGSRHGPKAGAKPLHHPGIPYF